MRGSFNHHLVVLSVVIAMLASYAALDLAGRVGVTRGNERKLWLGGGAVAMGLGMWSMHYIGMLAFQLPVPVLYHWPTVGASLLAAILASGVALYAASREKMGLGAALTGSVFMGAGIAGMHYIGMAAMRLPAECHYSSWLVSASKALAIVISLVALLLTFRFRNETRSWSLLKTLSAAVMGAAVPVTLAVRLLEKRGYLVSVAVNGREVVEAVQREDFAVILMDIQIPERDGFKATAAIREKELGTARHTPIVAMTAHALKGDEDRCLEHGMDAYIAKPIRSSQCYELLERLLDSREEKDSTAVATPGDTSALT